MCTRNVTVIQLLPEKRFKKAAWPCTLTAEKRRGDVGSPRCREGILPLLSSGGVLLLMF